MKIISRFLLIFSILVLPHFLYSQGFTEMDEMIPFEHVYGSGTYGGGPSFVDFNLDGLDDISMTSGNFDGLYLYQNTGDGFELLESPIENYNETNQIIWVDTDNDYDLDCYVTSKQINKLYINQGDFTFVDVTTTCGFDDPSQQSYNAVWFDYDDDGLLDLMVAHRTAFLVGFITLYHNLGDNEFEDKTTDAGLDGLGNSVLSFGAFDYNHDGWEDVHVGQDWGAGTLLLKNNGDGTFENVANESQTFTENNSMTSTIGDFNNDSWLDVYVTDTDINSYYVNLGGGVFNESAEEFGIQLNQFSFGATCFDAENDGDVDLYVDGLNSSAPHSCPMMMNAGPGQPFEMVNDEWGFSDDANTSSNGCAHGDFNGDGYPDLVKMNASVYHSLWRNDFNENNYLSVDLVGTISNSFAVGSVLEIVTGDLHQYRHVGCGEGWSSQNSYTSFFGLGDAEIIDSLVIRWPSGIDTTLINIAINQRITVFEGSAPTDGCTDEIACNYSPFAMDDDGSCTYPDEFYNCLGQCLSDTDGDNVCDEFEVLGCDDPIACNYDAEATENDSSCFYPDLYYDCDGNCISDIDNDGYCDELEIYGCDDETACNFNPESTESDGSCSFIENYVIQGNSTAIEGSVETFVYQFTSGSTYEWIVENGELQSGQGDWTASILLNGDVVSGDGVNICVIETNSTGCTSDMVCLEVGIFFIGIQELQNQERIFIWPNPVNDFLQFKSENLIKRIQIIDELGRIVYQTSTIENHQIDVSQLPSGIYFLELELENQNAKMLRIIKN